VASPNWGEVLRRYATPTVLYTPVRRAAFTVVTAGTILQVTPQSTRLWRPLTRGDYERSLPHVGKSGRAELQEASRNSSYIEAILADFASRR